MTALDIVGWQFTLLTVLERAENSPQGKSRWKCRCVCGNYTTVSREGLVRGTTTSCGCRKYAGFREEHARRTKYHSVADWLANCIPNGTCLEWCGYIAPDGYAHSGEHLHRKIFRLSGGGNPQVVMHICDNPKCINPDHLKAGTFKENSQDMSRKGRAGAMKLPRSVYPIIEEMLAAGFFQADVAAMFDVTQPTISAIHRRST